MATNYIPTTCYPVVAIDDTAQTIKADIFVDCPNGTTALQDYTNTVNAWIEANTTTQIISAFDDSGNFITPAPTNCTLQQTLATLPLQYEADGTTVSAAPSGYELNSDSTAYIEIANSSNTSYLQTNTPLASQYTFQPATQEQIDAYSAAQDKAIAEQATAALEAAQATALQKLAAYYASDTCWQITLTSATKKASLTKTQNWLQLNLPAFITSATAQSIYVFDNKGTPLTYLLSATEAQAILLFATSTFGGGISQAYMVAIATVSALTDISAVEAFSASDAFSGVKNVYDLAN